MSRAFILSSYIVLYTSWCIWLWQHQLKIKSIKQCKTSCCKEVNCIAGFCMFFFLYCIMRICAYMVIKILSLGVVSNPHKPLQCKRFNISSSLYQQCVLILSQLHRMKFDELMYSWLIFYLNLCRSFLLAVCSTSRNALWLWMLSSLIKLIKAIGTTRSLTMFAMYVFEQEVTFTFF